MNIFWFIGAVLLVVGGLVLMYMRTSPARTEEESKENIYPLW